jgi:ribosomal protein S18 acetylase RimI-like enzyme
MKIRKVKKEDLDQIYSLFLELCKEEDKSAYKTAGFLKRMRMRRKDFEKSVKKDILNDIKKRNSLYLVTEIDKRLVGYCLGSIIKTEDPFFDPEKFGYLNAMVVSSKFRKQGIARMMHNKLLQWMKAKGCKAVYLEVFSVNSAVSLYEKWGYRSTVNKMWKNLK